MGQKTILCYGDSNTWGYDPATQARFPRDKRWAGVLRLELGDGYLVIESMHLSRCFRQVAQELGCQLLDASEVMTSSDLDGIHFDLDEHRKLGQAVAGRVK